MKTLVLVEHDGKVVKDATLATVAAAAQLGEVHLLVAGSNVGPVATAAAAIAGTGKVHVADAAHLEHQLAEDVAPIAAALMGQHDAFLACSTTTGKNIAPRVAALLDVMQISEILTVEGPDSFTRPTYAGNAIATVKSSDAKLVITADGGWRKGKVLPLKPAVDEALDTADSNVEHVLVVRRGGNEVAWVHGRDLWWHETVAVASADHEAQAFPAENPLFILYTSGTTGKPKGILHTTGGYLTQVAFTHRNVFDLHPETDVYWCTADVGWITGHSYVVYGPLANGATQVIYEGTPDTPHPGRWWEIVQKYGVTILYTAPTAIRTFMKWGGEEPAKHDLSSLRLLGSVGEPINPEAWMWYREHIGGDRCPIVDTWWQTETGGIMISPLPGATTTKPGSATFALPGVSAEVIDDDGNRVDVGGGYLTLTRPWPGMLRGIWGDPERFRETYWSRFEGRYFAGDGAKLDDDGYLWLLGRVDDVMNISGHRISTTEVESALVSHPAVAEAAVVGATDATTGQAIIAYVILRAGEDVDAEVLRAHVASEIGAIAKPKQIYITPDLPKTRSGKIMRRLLRDACWLNLKTHGELQAKAAASTDD